MADGPGAASNDTRPPPGRGAFESASATHAGVGPPADEAAYRVGGARVRGLGERGRQYAQHTPSAPRAAYHSPIGAI